MEFKGPPVQVGEEYNLNIEAEGRKGDGIAKIQGYTIFIPGAKLDDAVKVKITRVMDNFAFAEIVDETEDDDNAKKEEETE